MARDHGRMPHAVTDSAGWPALPGRAQWLYMTLLSQRELTAAGTVSLTMNRWANLCADGDVDVVEEMLWLLTDRGLLHVDPAREELLVRNFAEDHHVLDSPNQARAYATAFPRIFSPLLQQLVRAELWALYALDSEPGHPWAWDALQQIGRAHV